MRSDTITMEREIADLQTELAEAAATHARERSQLEARITFLTKQIVMGMNTSRPSITISCDDPAMSFNLMAEKAALFDAMAAMRDIEVTQGKSTWAIWRERGRTVTLLGSGATLADAVKAAMEAMEAEKAKASSRLRTDPADWKAGR